MEIPGIRAGHGTMKASMTSSVAGRWVQGVVLVATIALGLDAVCVEPARLLVRDARVRLPGWPVALAGLRVAVLSDLHAGAPHLGARKRREIVERTNASRPDLVVLLGDYVVGGEAGARFVEPEVLARELGGLRAPLGVFAVLGNHDWWYDGPRVRRALEAAGLHVLENEAIALAREDRGARFWVAGLGDLWTRPSDPAAALRSVPPGEPVLLLAHNPDVFPTVPVRVTLTLAGHTHGGQVKLPALGTPIVPSRYGRRYAAGLVVEDGKRLFVTPGLGTSILPVRFGVPPEISLLTLLP